MGWLPDNQGVIYSILTGSGFDLKRYDLQSGETESLFTIHNKAGYGAISPDGQWITYMVDKDDGYRVLDGGGAPVFIPPGASDLSVAADGTISTDGQAVGQIGLFVPTEPLSLTREDGVMFRTDAGIEPAEQARVLQGFLEGSNVNAISQITRMIEVQRAYEMGQSFLQSEDERIRTALNAMTK